MFHGVCSRGENLSNNLFKTEVKVTAPTSYGLPPTILVQSGAYQIISVCFKSELRHATPEKKSPADMSRTYGSRDHIVPHTPPSDTPVVVRRLVLKKNTRMSVRLVVFAWYDSVAIPWRVARVCMCREKNLTAPVVVVVRPNPLSSQVVVAEHRVRMCCVLDECLVWMEKTVHVSPQESGLRVPYGFQWLMRMKHDLVSHAVNLHGVRARP